MNIFSTNLEWIHHLQLTELLSKYKPTIELCVNATIVFIVAVLFFKVLFTVILLPYTLKKSQKAMEIVIANAQKEFPDPDEIEPQNNNKKIE